MRSLRGRLLVAGLLAGCAPDAEMTGDHRRALADTLATLFDSLADIHQAVADTALLRRLHPAEDTLVMVHDRQVLVFTGDSLLRRVVNAHRRVASIRQSYTDRRVQLLDRGNAFLIAHETVEFTDTAGSTHRYEDRPPWS
jgi:hypothetical protein